MKAWWIVLLIALPLAGAQGEPGVTLEDAEGDVEAHHFNTGQSEPVSGFDAMDLTGATIVEDPTGFTVTVQAVDMTEETQPDQGNYFVWVTYGQMQYNIRMFQANDNGAPFGDVRQVTDGGLFGPVIFRPTVRVDADAETIWTHVPREVLLDQDGSPPIKGRQLEDIHVQTAAHATGVYAGPDNTSPAEIRDSMPDSWSTGTGENLAIQFGGSTAFGPVSVDTDRPFRASNGEATTFVYDIEARNTDAAARLYDVDVVDVPDGWNITAPGARLEIPAGGTVEFEVFATLPFQHQHGATETFSLQLIETTDPSVNATVQLGVHFHTIPQPAGHHDTVYLHSQLWSGTADKVNPAAGGTTGTTWFNTIDDDPGDMDEPISGAANVGGGTERYRWSGCLRPDLALGIATDLAAVGEGHFNLQTPRPADGMTVAGAIYWVPAGEPLVWCLSNEWIDRDVIPVATFEATPASFSAGQATNVVVPILPEDVVQPYEAGAQLTYILEITGPNPALSGETGFDLLPESSMTLPMVDYHTPLPASFLQADEEAPPAVEGFVPDEPEVEESPFAAAMVLVALLGAALRRRH